MLSDGVHLTRGGSSKICLGLLSSPPSSPMPIKRSSGPRRCGAMLVKGCGTLWSKKTTGIAVESCGATASCTLTVWVRPRCCKFFLFAYVYCGAQPDVRFGSPSSCLSIHSIVLSSASCFRPVTVHSAAPVSVVSLTPAVISVCRSRIRQMFARNGSHRSRPRSATSSTNLCATASLFGCSPSIDRRKTGAVIGFSAGVRPIRFLSFSPRSSLIAGRLCLIFVAWPCARFAAGFATCAMVLMMHPTAVAPWKQFFSCVRNLRRRVRCGLLVDVRLLRLPMQPGGGTRLLQWARRPRTRWLLLSSAFALSVVLVFG
mmetsp:Transcript_10402/g.31377  ORF Transcript_10402/g.31377 Transcript_10402/m.31377 type:complete len:315 (-) Transcript_10402:313-1257(-)